LCRAGRGGGQEWAAGAEQNHDPESPKNLFIPEFGHFLADRLKFRRNRYSAVNICAKIHIRGARRTRQNRIRF
jgi:hypothetical protein